MKNRVNVVDNITGDSNPHDVSPGVTIAELFRHLHPSEQISKVAIRLNGTTLTSNDLNRQLANGDRLVFAPSKVDAG